MVTIHLYFGEVLGKHSEVHGTLSEGELVMVTDDDHFVQLFEKHNLESGHNPFYCEYQDDDYDVNTVKEYIIKKIDENGDQAV